jgi:hypothetical protein
MSMLWMFEKLLADPVRVETEDREERVAREREDEDEAAPPTLQCKACGYEGPERYCPSCLADTMVLIRRKVVKPPRVR